MDRGQGKKFCYFLMHVFTCLRCKECNVTPVTLTPPQHTPYYYYNYNSNTTTTTTTTTITTNTNTNS